MASASSAGGGFEVDMSDAIGHELRELQRSAARAGFGPEFNAALHAIVARLHHDPDEFGEPIYRLPALRMQLRHGVIRPISVHYGVCEERPQVFIKGQFIGGCDITVEMFERGELQEMLK